MTKKQTEEMDRLAGELDLEFDNYASFVDGYKSAQQPEQLILNEYVKALVAALECNETFHRLGGIDDCEPCKALKPFKDLGGEGE